MRNLWREVRLEATKHAFRHAVPQGLCADLINALELLANQQEDGYGLLQNIVKDLGKESRQGLTNGLREFNKVDNERALDVGSLSQGTRDGFIQNIVTNLCKGSRKGLTRKCLKGARR